jgi:hypothetical protein
LFLFFPNGVIGTWIIASFWCHEKNSAAAKRIYNFWARMAPEVAAKYPEEGNRMISVQQVATLTTDTND